MPGQDFTPALCRVGRAFWGPRHRQARVAAVLAAVVLLSLADLYMTLVHLLNFGLLEGNPVARAIMEHGSPAALIMWKLLTTGFAVGVLFWARRRWTAELGAVFCCLAMVWLLVRWTAYNDQIHRVATDLQQVAGAQDEVGWVTMVPGS